MIQIVVVEYDVELQQSLCKRLNSVDDFECSHCFSGGRNAVSQIPELHPDVILMDINLPDMSGVDCVATLMNQQPHLKILMFIAFEIGKDFFAALKAGASGYPAAILLNAMLLPNYSKVSETFLMVALP